MPTKRVPPVSLRSLALPAAAFLLVWLLGLAGGLKPLDRAWYDWLQRAYAGSATLPEDTALVLIDEQSLQALGAEPYAMRWPWPRGAFAAMFAALHRAGATSIAADLIFFEQSGAAEQDMLLGAVAAGICEVTLGAVPAIDGREAQLPVVWPDGFRDQFPDLFADQPRWGFVRPEQDSDGVIRRHRLGGSLAEVALGRANPGDGPAGRAALLRWRGGLEKLRQRGVPLLPAAPFVAAGWQMLDAATEAAPDLDPAGIVRAIDAQPMPEGEVFEAVRGKRVLVAANAAATFDYVATPVGAPEPGVLVHWTALASLEADDDLVPAGWLPEVFVLLLAVGVVGYFGRGALGLRSPAIASGAWALAARRNWTTMRWQPVAPRSTASAGSRGSTSVSRASAASSSACASASTAARRSSAMSGRSARRTSPPWATP